MQKKRGIQFFFAILIGWMALFCLPAGYAYASQKEADAPLSMDVSYGFDNTAKSDRYLRVTVLLNNDTAPFEGTLEFLTAQSSLEAYQYSYPLSLAAGEKFEQEYYIPLGVRADQMFVSVQDVNGKTIIRKRLKLGSEEDVAESYIGILTDTPEALSYLDGAGIRYGTLRTRAVFLDAEQAPDDRLGYDPLDLVIVSGFDLDSLSDVQYEALRRWVEDGGTILFGGGVDCARNYGRFAEKVLEPPYLDAVTVPVSLGGETAPGEQTGEIQAECVDVNLKNGSTLLAGEVFPLLSHTNCKQGRIVAAAFSMDAISDLCLTNPSSFEKLYTLVLGSDTVDELAQEDYYGYSGSYFSVPGVGQHRQCGAASEGCGIYGDRGGLSAFDRSGHLFLLKKARNLPVLSAGGDTGGVFVYRHYLCAGRKDTLPGAVCDVCVDSGYLGRRGGRSHLYEHPKPL